MLKNNLAYFDSEKNEIVLNPVKFELFTEEAARANLEVAMAHEMVHAAGYGEREAYDVTLEAMKTLDPVLFANQIDIIAALLALARRQVEMDEASKEAVVQIVDQIFTGKGDRAELLEALLNKVQSGVIIYKGAKELQEIAGVKAASSVAQLNSLAKSAANSQHSSVLVMDANLQDVGLQAALDALVAKGFSVFVYTENDITSREGGVSRIFWTGQLAAWLGKDQFIRMLEVLPDAQTGRFSMQACLANQH